MQKLSHKGEARVTQPDHRVAIKKPVFIGNRNPGDHWAPAIKRFVRADELYRPRRG